MMNAQETLDFVQALNIKLTVSHGELQCDFAESSANDDAYFLQLIKHNKAELIALIGQQAANEQSYAPNLPTEPPQAYTEALWLLDELIDHAKGKPVWRKDWRIAMMQYFGCSDWDAQGLETDIRGDEWVRFTNWYNYVEPTTPLAEWQRLQESRQMQEQTTANRCRLNPPFKCGRCDKCLKKV